MQISNVGKCMPPNTSEEQTITNAQRFAASDETTALDRPTLNRAIEYTWRILSPFLRSAEALTLEQAFEKARKKSSPGVLFTALGHSKIDVLDEFGPVVRFLVREVAAGRGLVPISSFSEKDENVSHKKHLSGNYRLFNASGLVKTICSMILFGGIEEQLHKACYDSPFCVGLTPFSMQDIYPRMLRNQPAADSLPVFSTDGKNFETSVLNCMQVSHFAAMFDYVLPNADFTAWEMENLFAYVVHYCMYETVVTPGGTVFLKTSGNGSGNHTTAIMNTLANISQTVYVVLREHPEYDFKKLEETVTLAACGDDSLRVGGPSLQAEIQRKLETGLIVSLAKSDESHNPFDVPFLSRIPVSSNGKLFTALVPDRALASWLYHSYGKHEKKRLELALQRTLSLRLECWFIPALRVLFDDFFWWAVSENKARYGHQKWFRDLVNAYHSPQFVRRLYGSYG